jgi:uncharacterized membrane protein YccF (DUF307 family)
MRARGVEATLRDMRVVNVLLNVLWVILAGFWLAVGYLLAAILMFILIITIPFGVQAAKLAGFAFWPFGRHVERKASAGAGSVIGNVIWFVLAGWWLALAHLVTGVALFITIIGIPLAIANFKLIPMALVPFGREVVPNTDVAAPGPQAQAY